MTRPRRWPAKWPPTQLHAAQDLAERLGQAARHACALDLAPHAEATRELLRHLDPAQDGAYPGPVHGQDAHKLDAQRQPSEPVERPATPTITFDTRCTLAQLSEASIVHYAASDQAWVAQGDWHAAAAHTASLVTGGTASWYTHEGGIQLKAAHGPVSVRAHTDRLQILADQCQRHPNNPQVWQLNIPHPSHARSIRWNRKIDSNWESRVLRLAWRAA